MELFAIPGNPVPSNAFVGSVVTSDGVTLRYARWRPTSRRTLGTICLIQGRAEFIEKYFETITQLRRRGFAVVAFDLRGQGGSERLLSDARKGHVDDFAEYGEDISTILQSVMIPSMPKPYFAIAHSMGAAALLLALERGETRFERVVLLAPLIGLVGMKFSGLASAAASILDFLALGTRYVPTGGATSLATKPFAGNRLSSDPVRYQRVADIVAARPRLALGDPTIRWTFAMFQMFKRFAERDFGRRLVVPSLMLIPGADPLCSSHAAEALAARIRACQPVIIPGARHEILTERDSYRAQFFAAFDRFIPGETHEQDLLSQDAHEGLIEGHQFPES
ncbi:MAG: alpha/beta fold hydrolase [Beijerinckiaceae bacterium]